MGLEKVTYVDGTTVITAQNLNAIQDSIIDLEASRTVPSNVRNAIYTLLENAAYVTTGLEDEMAVVEAWAEEVTSLTLSVSTLSLDSDDPQAITATTVPIGATVTWSSSNNSVATVSDGIVTGVSNGSCVITASAGELVATCDVTVAGFAELVSISAVYTQSGTVRDTDSVDSLKADLVVTATYDDSSTETVPSTDYTLSGTLEIGTSTITVSFRGKITTFTVTVVSGGFTYTADDGLLSEQDFVTSVQYVGSANYLSESIVDGCLKLSASKTGQSSGTSTIYYFSDIHWTNKATITLVFKVLDMVSIGPTNTTTPGSFAIAIDNGEESLSFASVGFARYQYATGNVRVRNNTGSGSSWNNATISLDTFHTLVVTLENNAQTVKLDGTTIASNQAVYTNTTYFDLHGGIRIMTNNSSTVDIRIQSLEVVVE